MIAPSKTIFSHTGVPFIFPSVNASHFDKLFNRKSGVTKEELIEWIRKYRRKFPPSSIHRSLERYIGIDEAIAVMGQALERG